LKKLHFKKWKIKYKAKDILNIIKHFCIIHLTALIVLILTYGIINFPQYIYGLKLVILHSVIGHRSYLLGVFSKQGFWYYYPFVFLIKTPIAILALLILTIILARKIKAKNEHVYFAIILICFILITIKNKINIGLRHILPIYPFIFLYCSKITKIKLKAKNIIIILLVIFLIFSTVNAHPNYISYFNEFAGDKPYDYVIDSNIDWGQDLKGLKVYMEEHNINNITMAYYGSGSRDYRKITWTELSCKPQPGLFAVSVNRLIGFTEKDSSCLWWLRELEPIDNVGNSIIIYNVKNEEAQSFLDLTCENSCTTKCSTVGKTYQTSLYNQTCKCACN